MEREDPEEMARLIEAAIRNEGRARHRLFVRTYDTMKAGIAPWIQRFPALRPRHEDIVQHAFVRLLQHDAKLLRAFDPMRGRAYRDALEREHPTPRLEARARAEAMVERFGVYLRMVGHQTAYRAWRKKGVSPRDMVDEVDVEQMLDRHGPSLEDLLSRQERFDRALQLIEELSPYDRGVLVGEYWLGETAKETARRLDRTESAIQQARCRLRRKLRKLGQTAARDDVDAPGSASLQPVLALLIVLGAWGSQPPPSAETSSSTARGD